MQEGVGGWARGSLGEPPHAAGTDTGATLDRSLQEGGLSEALATSRPTQKEKYGSA